MPDIVLISFLKPLLLLVLAVTVLYPARIAVQRKMKDGKLKRLLLRRID
jgi:hypothetical protein